MTGKQKQQEPGIVQLVGGCVVTNPVAKDSEAYQTLHLLQSR